MTLVDGLRWGLRNVKDTGGMDQADRLMKQGADRIEALEQALREIDDAQMLWHGGIGPRSREQLQNFIDELKAIARAALKEGE